MRGEMVIASQLGTVRLDQLSQSFEQGIDAGKTGSLVEFLQALNLEENQRTGEKTILGRHEKTQLHVEIAPVG